MSSRPLVRFAVEAAFIVLVAVATRVADLRPAAIVGVMAAAYAAAVTAEQVARRRFGAHGGGRGSSEDESASEGRVQPKAPPREATQETGRVAEPSLPARSANGAAREGLVEEQRRRVSLDRRVTAGRTALVLAGAGSGDAEADEEERRQDPLEPPGPAAGISDVSASEAGSESGSRTSAAPDRRWVWRRGGRQAQDDELAGEARSEPSPPSPPRRLCETCGNPISEERLRVIPNATQCIDCKRGLPVTPAQPFPDRRPQPTMKARSTPSEPVQAERSAAPQPHQEEEREKPDPTPVQTVEESLTEAFTLSSPDAREWNVWELERLSRTVDSPARKEEWEYLLVYLREFANVQGALPADFDALVRESFPEVVEAVESS